MTEKNVINNVKNLQDLIKKATYNLDPSQSQKQQLSVSKMNIQPRKDNQSQPKSKLHNCPNIVDIMIKNNNDNELFRIAWKELIDESSVDFDRRRQSRIHERIKESKQNQEWKSIIITSPNQVKEVVIEQAPETDDSTSETSSAYQERIKQLKQKGKHL